MKSVHAVLCLAALMMAIPSCGDGSSSHPSAQAPAASLPQDLFTTVSPENPHGVKELRENAKPGDEVVVTGRIGGRVDPFSPDRAIVLIAEKSMPTCDKAGSMENCKTPWDYCCDDPSMVAANLATVQVVDAAGKPLKASLQGAGKLQPKSEIVVKGKVAQKDDKMLVINATSIFVKG
jgi:hypothetical protein